nr:CSC1-like protein At4g02900 [Ipomoea batatas]
MAAEEDILFSAAINLLSAFSFLLAFAVLRIQPVNDRVYFPKWYLKGIRASPRKSGPMVRKFVNLDLRTYIRFLNWMPPALHMPQPELIDHAGLDSAVYIRIYLLGLKIFVPIALLAFAVLVPVNWTGGSLQHIKDLTFNEIDKLSISNIPSGSPKLWAHIAMAYVISFWTLYALYQEYEIVSRLRLQFLAAEKRRPDQFTVSAFKLYGFCARLNRVLANHQFGSLLKVLVRNVPPDNDETVSEHVEHFFCVNHPDHYLLHQVVYNANMLASLVEEKKNLQNWLTYYQTVHERNPSKKPKTKTGFWGLWGETVDAIDYYTSEIKNLSEKEAEEREKVLSDPNAIVPAAFVSFKTRWGAAVCAQTQQSNNPTIWLTDWAPEPRDVFWNSLAIPYVELNIRKLLMAVAFFFLTFFFMIPIAFVQSLASIEGIEKVFPFLTPVIEKEAVTAFVQGFLPGMVLKLFLANVPKILMAMSKVEGVTSLSALERSSAAKYHLFLLVNVFLGSIIAGAAFQQLDKFLSQPPTEIPKTIGVAIPIKATFFISFIMVDGWAAIAAEILRLAPLIVFHIKDAFLVKTDKDRQEAMDPGSIAFSISEPRIQLYFLLGLVYAVITPIILPFIIVFFAFAYLIINVYDQKYESGAAFWPDIHRRIIIGLVIAQVQLMGLMNTKNVAHSGPVIIILPVLTIWFHNFCKGRFESAFVKFPLQEAKIKDTLEKATEPTLNLRTYLTDAYVHPVFKGKDKFEATVSIDEEENDPLVATKRIARKETAAQNPNLNL